MRTVLVTILLFLVSCCNGQKYAVLSNELAEFIKNVCTNDTDLFWINNITRLRDIRYLEQKLNAAPSTKIKITEVWDKKNNAYGIKEEYVTDSIVKDIYRDKTRDTLYNYNWANRFSFPKLDTLPGKVITFGPNTVEAFCGCGQVAKKIRKSCFKSAADRAKKEGVTAETFSRLITYIDLENQKIRFVLEIPISGERKLYYGLWDPDNRNWYE